MAHKRRDLGLVTSPILAGVERLVATPLTLNGETPTPIVQLVGVDADGTAHTWTDRLNGEVLLEDGSGSSPTYDVAGPTGDVGVKGAGSGNKYIVADDTSYGQLSAGDFALEFVVSQHDATAYTAICSTWYWPAAGLYVFHWNNKIYCRIDDGTNVVGVMSAANSAQSWDVLHGLLLVDHTRYGQWYVNGAAGGATDISAVGDFSSSLNFMLFARGSCGYMFDESTHVLHLLQIWPFSDIGSISSVSADDVARERAAIAMGHQALHSHGALTPLTL